MRETIVRDVNGASLVLLGAVGFILPIACANTANFMLLSRAARRREMAIRTALGATRRRIVQQLLTESVLLAFAGGALGLFIASLSNGVLAALPEQILPRAQSIHVDARVLAFTFALALATGIAFGLAPALGLAKEDPAKRLKEAGSLVGRARGGLGFVRILTEAPQYGIHCSTHASGL